MPDLGADQAERLADPAVPAAIRTDHPHYRRNALLPADVRASLVADLKREPEPLLAPSAAESAPRDRELFRSARVRAFAPAQSAARGHRIVEPLVPVRSLLVADADLLAEVLGTSKRSRLRAAERVAQERPQLHTAPRKKPASRRPRGGKLAGARGEGLPLSFGGRETPQRRCVRGRRRCGEGS